MMPEESLYEELGGGSEVPPAYVEHIGRDCHNCGAAMGQVCTNPLTGKPRKIPCALR